MGTHYFTIYTIYPFYPFHPYFQPCYPFYQFYPLFHHFTHFTQFTHFTPFTHLSQFYKFLHHFDTFLHNSTHLTPFLSIGAISLSSIIAPIDPASQYHPFCYHPSHLPHHFTKSTTTVTISTLEPIPFGSRISLATMWLALARPRRPGAVGAPWPCRGGGSSIRIRVCGISILNRFNPIAF